MGDHIDIIAQSDGVDKMLEPHREALGEDYVAGPLESRTAMKTCAESTRYWHSRVVEAEFIFGTEARRFPEDKA
jgi:hypothetical protein